MIRGENEHGRCMIASHDPASPKRDRGSGIAFRRFSNDVFFWKIPEQFANSALLFGVRQDQNALIRNKTLKARQSFFEQSFIRNQAQQLFGPGTPAQRPETFTAAAGEDKRVYRIWHVLPFVMSSEVETSH